MASEVFQARESGVKPINATGATRRPAVLMSNAQGKTVSFAPSSDKGKNEAMRFLSEHLAVTGTGNTPSVDGFIRERDGSYEVKVWNTYGNRWGSGKYGSIVSVQNNTDKVLSIKKLRGRWTGTLKERRYYGQKDVVTKLF